MVSHGGRGRPSVLRGRLSGRAFPASFYVTVFLEVGDRKKQGEDPENCAGAGGARRRPRHFLQRLLGPLPAGQRPREGKLIVAIVFAVSGLSW